MVCDALTKDKADPADLLRDVITSGGRYQLSSEAEVLQIKKAQRAILQNRRSLPAQPAKN